MIVAGALRTAEAAGAKLLPGRDLAAEVIEAIRSGRFRWAGATARAWTLDGVDLLLERTTAPETWLVVAVRRAEP